VRVLDSNTKAAWTLTNSARVDDGIVLSSNGKIEALIPSSGRLSFKIVAKNISGSGGLKARLIDGDNNTVLLKELKFTKKSWSEKVLNLSISSKLKGSTLQIFRPQNSFGRVQIGRIIVEGEKEAPAKKRTEKLFSKKILSTTQPKKRLAVIIPYGIYGGAEVYLKSIFSNLENPFITDFIYLSKNKLEAKVSNPKISHIYIKSAQRVRASLIASDYDIVIFYNSKRVYSLLSSLKKANAIRSEVIEIYHSDFEWSDSVSSLRTREGVDKIFRISDTLCEDILGVKSKHTIPVGIDTEYFKRKSNNPYNSGPATFGLVARLSPEKNIEYAIELFRKSPSLTLIIIGGGPRLLDLMKYVDKKGIKNIQFTGHLEDVTDYYNTIDAFILTSKIEGTPISIIEAMAFGLPIFTTDVGEIRANFGHLDNFHFLTGNIKEDVEILSKNFEKRCLFNNLREYVLENHSSRLNSNLFFNILLENMLITAPADPNKMMLNGTYY